MSTMASKKRKGLPYMREHSNVIRLLSKNSYKTIKEDNVMNFTDKASRIMLVVTCRNRQRKLQGAWNRWMVNTDCVDLHDYKSDMVAILSRPIDDDEKRTELEVEVILKWVVHTYHLDPTGVQHTIFMCNSKTTAVNAIQTCRLEKYFYPEHIVLQNQSAGADEGLYTILNGKVDISIFSPDSVNLIRLETARKHKNDEEIAKILKYGTRVAQLSPNSGFGELSAIANVRRGASVCASKSSSGSGTDVFVVIKDSLIELLAKQHTDYPAEDGEEEKKTSDASPEVMDYLRQSGLAHKTAISDLMQAASCFRKIACESGAVLYRKGDRVDKVFIVLSGSFLLDTGEYDDSKNHTGLPFQTLEHSKCYILRRGSILGDEGMIGKNKFYHASAMSLSEDNIIFEVSNFGLTFLAKRFGLEKYSALAMKEQSPSNNDLASVLKSEVMVHSAFTSLRKCIASQNPSRGFRNTKKLEELVTAEDDLSTASTTSSVFPPLPPSPITKSRSSVSKSHSSGFQSNKLSSKKTKVKGESAQFSLHKTRGSTAPEDYARLPRAAMHHARMIVKQVQIRELSVLRNNARDHVKEAAEELRISKLGPKNDSSTIAAKRDKQLLEDKYQRAVAIYKAHTNEQLTHRVYDLQEEGSDMDVVSASTSTFHDMTTSGIDSAISYDVDDVEIDEDDVFSADEEELIAQGMDTSATKTEQYLFILALKRKKMDQSSAKVPELRGEAPSSIGAKLTAEALKDLGVGAPSSVVVPFSQESKSKKEKGGFLRMITVHTAGVETVLITDKEGVTRRIFAKQQLKLPVHGGAGMPAAQNIDTADSSIASDPSFSKKNPKVFNGVPPVLSIEALFGIEPEATNKSISYSRSVRTTAKKHFAPEHLWVTRYMKSSNTSLPDKKLPPLHGVSDDDFDSHKLGGMSEVSYGRGLIQHARKEVESSKYVPKTDRPTAKLDSDVSAGNDVAAKSRRRKSQWTIIAQDPLAAAAEHAVVEEARADVLKSFNKLMSEERQVSSYIDGRRKNVTQSEFRFNRDEDKLHTVDEIQSLEKVNESSKDLLLWKKFCSERVLDVNKSHVLKQIPIKSKVGSHTIYWGKLMIEKNNL